MARTHDIVEVTWEDHSFHFGDSVPEPAPMTIKTVGYLIADTPQAIVLAFSLKIDQDAPAEFQVIDKRMWVETKVIKEKKSA